MGIDIRFIHKLHLIVFFSKSSLQSRFQLNRIFYQNKISNRIIYFKSGQRTYFFFVHLPAFIHHTCYFTIMRIRFQCGNGDIFRQAVISQIFVAVTNEFLKSFTDKPESHTQPWQAIKFGKSTGNNQIIILIH